MGRVLCAARRSIDAAALSFAYSGAMRAVVLVLLLACGAPAPAPVTLPSVASSTPTATPQAPTAARTNPYPNEIEGYKFWATAKWRTLVPLESTLADVRRVLGAPESESDIASLSAPYPGDDKAVQPVLSYSLSDGWHAYVYLVRSNLSVASKYAAAVQDRLLSIDLVPDASVPFAGRVPESIFHVDKSVGVVSELVYADGSGLSYQVYLHTSAHEHTRAGDLDRIVYGPSDAARRRAAP
jgi:hypothetical protein